MLSVPEEHRGRLSGVVERLPELVEAGVTTVALNLVCTCGPDLLGGRRVPLAFFSPDSALSQDPAEAGAELKKVEDRRPRGLPCD